MFYINVILKDVPIDSKFLRSEILLLLFTALTTFLCRWLAMQYKVVATSAD